MIPRPQTLLLFLLVTCFSVSCIPQTPIPIYVTPTPQTQTDQTMTAIPTAGGLSPTETPAESQAEAAATDTEAPTTMPATAAASTPGAQPTFLGAIVGPDYTPPPTFTPRPTDTPALKPTEEKPEATATRTPTPGPSPTPVPGLDPAQIGVQVHTLLDQPDWDEVLRLTSQLGLGWAKVQIDWELLEPGGQGDIGVDFRRQELYIESLKKKGLKVLVSVAKAPNWARSTQAESGPPDDPQVLVNFLNVMMQEFGNSIDAIEIWNEPNLLREWQGRPMSGAEYMRYFTPAYQAINAYSDRMATDPKEPRSTPIIVVTAGLAPTSTTDASVDDRAYLQQMYDAGLGQFR
ncbi:MAG: hypothetical protein K8J31_06510, partial [Anaerolineae bacterium]|nr:hypothetical protein [Anaerolineae bacterium]